MQSIRTEEVYEGLFDNEAFARLPSMLADSVQAKSAVLHWRHRAGNFEMLAFSNFAADAIGDFARQWAMQDPWTIAAVSPQRLNRLFLVEEAVPQSVFARSAVYNDFCRSEADDTFYCIGGAFSASWGEGFLGVHRGRREKGFETADLERLTPHTQAIGQVLRLKGEIAAAQHPQALHQATIDALALAIVTIDRIGRPTLVNKAATAVLQREDGFILRQGRVSARSPSDASALERAIATATAPNAPNTAAAKIKRQFGCPYLITVVPLIGLEESQRAMLVFRDPGSEDRSLAKRLRALFSLSAAEAEVAVKLGEGWSATEIADARGVTLNTLNAQLKAVMAKTGCNRQAEVAAMVAALPGLRRT